MGKLNRRQFLEMSALAGGAALMGGCACPCCGGSCERVPYGDTVGDRLWMWGHHVDSSKYAGRCAGVGESFIDGLIFHPTFAAALDVPAVRLSKEWIAEHGDGKSG